MGRMGRMRRQQVSHTDVAAWGAWPHEATASVTRLRRRVGRAGHMRRHHTSARNGFAEMVQFQHVIGRQVAATSGYVIWPLACAEAALTAACAKRTVLPAKLSLLDISSANEHELTNDATEVIPHCVRRTSISFGSPSRGRWRQMVKA